MALLVLLAVLPFFGLSLWQNFKQRATEKQRAVGEITALARLVAANEAGFVRNAHQLLATLTGFPALVLGTNKQFSEIHLQNLLKLTPDYINFGLIENDGSLFVSAVPPPRRGLNLADRAYFKRTIGTGRFAIGDFQVGRISEKPSLNFAYPVFDEAEKLQRVLFASLNLQIVSGAISNIDVPEGATVTILDRQGSVVARVPDGERWMGKYVGEVDLIRRALAAKTGVIDGIGLDNVRRLYSIAQVSDGREAALLVLVGVPTDLLFQASNEALTQSLLLLSLLTLTVLAGARVLAERSILQPVRTLAESANRLAGSDLSARVKLGSGAAELHELEHAFNAMAENLQKREADLKQATADIQRMNQELEEKVQERTSQLTSAVHELESFSYSVSHDLRAPLRHMDGFAQLLEKSQADRLDDKGKRHLAIISQAAKKMGHLIDDLLLFSRMGRQEMMKSECDLNTLVKEIIADLQPELENRNIEWQIADLPRVHADAAMIKQALVNLLSNAVKYTRPRNPARIEFGWKQESPSRALFHVKDNGVGFDMRFAKKLFGVFQRLHLESEFEGTGVGLANVRRIITRHGGEVWAESEPNVGSTFYFTLPINENT